MTGAGGRRRVLVVEDEYALATEASRGLATAGIEVVGPTASIDDALDLLDATERLDGAVLDLNLQGEMAFPVADALMERGVPFVFATGYDASAIPARYAAVPRCEKPVGSAAILRVLFGPEGAAAGAASAGRRR